MVIFNKRKVLMDTDDLKKKNDDSDNLMQASEGEPEDPAEVTAAAPAEAADAGPEEEPAPVQAEEARSLRPEKIIPFKMTREEAVAACREFYKGRRLLPGPLRSEAQYEEMQGGFVPYLLYSGDASFNISYEAQDSLPVGGDPVVKKQLKEYTARRQGEASYRRIQVNASKDVPDAFMHNIEPYRYRDLIPIEQSEEFHSIEDLNEISIDEDEKITKKRIDEVIAQAARQTVHHNYVAETEQTIVFDHSETECVLFPLWVMTAKCGRRYYHFAMNGQTGKTTGDLPVSQLKSLGCFLGSFLAGGAVMFGLLRLFYMLIGTPSEKTVQIMLFIGVVAGLMTASQVMSRLYEEMRPPKKKKDDTKRFENCIVKIANERDKLMRRDMVDAKNKIVRSEEFD